MSTMEGVQYRGGNLLLFEYSTVLNTPMILMISLHMYHDIPQRYSNFKGWYPPTVLNTPTVFMISPTCIMISPRIENPNGTQDNPHCTHDIPHGTEHPMVLKISPTFIMISPTVLNTQRYSRYPPMVLMISSHSTEHPHGTANPHSTAHIIQGVNCKSLYHKKILF